MGALVYRLATVVKALAQLGVVRHYILANKIPGNNGKKVCSEHWGGGGVQGVINPVLLAEFAFPLHLKKGYGSP